MAGWEKARRALPPGASSPACRNRTESFWNWWARSPSSFPFPKKTIKRRKEQVRARPRHGRLPRILYYVHKQLKKDWDLKLRMEAELDRHQSYGSRRLSEAIGIGRPRAQRVMRIFGIKP